MFSSLAVITQGNIKENNMNYQMYVHIWTDMPEQTLLMKITLLLLNRAVLSAICQAVF